MKALLLFFLLLPTLMAAQISTRTHEITQRQKFYKTGDWSSWLRRESGGYRYHWGLNPLEDTYKDKMDVTFEIRNEDNKRGYWQIEILKCSSDEVISEYTRLTGLEPNELKTITFLVPNCGSMDEPRLRYKIRRVFPID